MWVYNGKFGRLAAGHLAYLLLELAVRGARLRAELLAIAQACQRWITPTLSASSCCEDASEIIPTLSDSEFNLATSCVLDKDCHSD